MIRAFGCLLVIGAATLMGVAKASDIREQYAQMQRLERIICALQGEMRYARAHLGEIFERLGHREEEPYQSWLLELSRRMDEKREGTFGELWSQSIAASLRTSRLPGRELERLESLGSQLGSADLTLQIRTLELYLEQLSQAMEERRGQMRTKVRLCHCLGVMGGIFTAVLLL